MTQRERFENILKFLPKNIKLKIKVVTYDENLKEDVSRIFTIPPSSSVQEIRNIYTEWCNKYPRKGKTLKTEGSVDPDNIFLVWIPDEVKYTIKMRENHPLLFYYILRGIR